MQFNSVPNTTRRLTACVALLLAALAGSLIAPSAAAAETMYTFDGMQFSAADRAKIGMADNQVKMGIAALNRNDWTAALQHCRTAWGAYSDLIPINDKTRVFFDQAGSCMADAHANLGDVNKACGIYRSNGYQTYRMRDPRGLCAKQPVKAEISPNNPAKTKISSSSNNEYAGVAGSFINRLAQLSAMPYGSARYAKAAELVPDCDKLRSYAASVPPALAAAGFCSGVVARERVDARTSCKIMWTSAGQIRNAFASPLTPNIRAHAIDLKAMLDSFGQTCARDGYPWPEFSAAWPH